MESNGSQVGLCLSACRDLTNDRDDSHFMGNAYYVYQTAGQRFAEYFLTVAQQASRSLRPESRWKQALLELGETSYPYLRRTEVEAISLLEAERINLLHAVEWAHDNEEWALACQLADELAPFFNMRSYWSDWLVMAELVASDAVLANDLRLTSDALNNLSVVYRQLENYPAAIDHCRRGLDLCRQLGHSYGEGLALGNLGGIHFAKRDLSAALQYYLAALRIFERLDDHYGQAQSLMGISITLAKQGKLTQAMTKLEACLAIQRTIGDRFGEAQSLNNLGIIQRLQGQIPQAIESFESSLKLKRELGDKQGTATALSNMSYAYQQLGELDPAIAAAEESLMLFIDLHTPEAERVARQLARVKKLKQSKQGA